MTVLLEAALYDHLDDKERMERVMRACASMIDYALNLRLELLSEGWGTGHRLCKALDDVAREWADQHEAQYRQLEWTMKDAFAVRCLLQGPPP